MDVPNEHTQHMAPNNGTISKAKSNRAAAAAMKRETPATTRPKARTDAELAERRALVFERWRASKTFREIGSQLGLDVSTVHADFTRALAELLPIEEVEETRRMELDRLEGIGSVMWARAMDGDLKAANSYVMASARIARLAGLDRPVEVGTTWTEMHMVLVMGALKVAVEAHVPKNEDRIRILDIFEATLEESVNREHQGR